MPFVKGKSGNPEGGRISGGGGRHAEYLRAKCRKLVDKHKLIEFLVQLASGNIMDHRWSDGHIVQLPASVHDRQTALDTLLDRGYGKPVQEIESEALSGILDTMREKYK